MNLMSSFIVGILFGLSLFGLHVLVGPLAGSVSFSFYNALFETINIISYIIVGMAGMFIASVLALFTLK